MEQRGPGLISPGTASKDRRAFIGAEKILQPEGIACAKALKGGGGGMLGARENLNCVA